MDIAVIMTCYNRCSKTEKCIKSLMETRSSEFKYNLKFYVTDDLSTDGTTEMLLEYQKKYNNIEIIKGTGSLYWNKGMYKAFELAMKEKVDAYLWVNDDVDFLEDSINTLLTTYTKIYKDTKEIIVVGSTKSKIDNKITYGGVMQNDKLRRVKYDVVEPSKEIKTCDTMNGNCVLISKEAVLKVGNLDYRYEHGMGDYDYGIRARNKNIDIYIAEDYVGYCERNKIKGTWKDTSLTRGERFKLVRRPTGLPIKSWFIYTMKYAGVLKGLWFVKPYLDILLNSNKVVEQ